ncbi:hypothetical protein [Rubrivirga sp.]|uniref:hypothetical protein n=1 Tax=Rubrivirga sp. TaxID=1885344 RepID=UPI003C715C08
MSTTPEPGSDADRDPAISDGEAPQAMRVFTKPAQDDVALDPDNPAFDRVQTEKEVDGEYEREYNRRYVKEHGDHHGHEGTDAAA